MAMSNFILKKAAYYYYNTLSEKEQELYKSFLYAFMNMKKSVDISEVYTTEQVQKISRYILNDRPDIFWYRGSFVITTCNNVITKAEFKYIYTEAQKESIINDMENSAFFKLVDEKLESAKNGFYKALALYETIIQNSEYEKNAVNSDSSYYNYAYGLEGIILKHRAVCSGYSKAFQYFANRHGILCTLVTGMARNEHHAWNMINFNGNYYYIDVTWGDPTFLNQSDKDPDYVSYNYFCVTTDDLKQSHNPKYDDPMPLCTETEFNYYEFFGMKEDRYSVENVASHIVNAVKNDKDQVVIRYTSQSAYDDAVNRLFKKSEVFDALKLASKYTNKAESERISYNLDDNNNIISINI